MKFTLQLLKDIFHMFFHCGILRKSFITHLGPIQACHQVQFRSLSPSQCNKCREHTIYDLGGARKSRKLVQLLQNVKKKNKAKNKKNLAWKIQASGEKKTTWAKAKAFGCQLWGYARQEGLGGAGHLWAWQLAIIKRKKKNKWNVTQAKEEFNKNHSKRDLSQQMSQRAV